MYKLNIFDYVSFHTCTKSNQPNQKKLYFTSNFKKIASVMLISPKVKQKQIEKIEKGN